MLHEFYESKNHSASMISIVNHFSIYLGSNPYSQTIAPCISKKTKSNCRSGNGNCERPIIDSVKTYQTVGNVSLILDHVHVAGVIF